MQTIKISFQEFSDIDFISPSAFYIKDCLGDFIFIKTRDRQAAQNWVNDNYGQGKYIVRASKLVQPKGELSAKGYVGAKSRAGSRCVK